MSKRILLLLAAGTAAGAYLLMLPEVPDREPEEVTPILPVDVRNSAGRSGAYYRPSDLDPVDVPVLVLTHPTGSSGRAFIPAFRALADSLGFLVVAPDSRVTEDGTVTWQAGDRRGDITDDLSHVMAVLRWVEGETLLAFDPDHILLAGFSGGGIMAPYVATNRSPFTHAAILHGWASPGGFGSRRVPLWLSTNHGDEIVTVGDMGSLAPELGRLGYEVTLRSYAGAHNLSSIEKRELVDWWLGSR
jgi:predicted esterase